VTFSARFRGTRGSVPTPGSATCHFGGNSSCVELQVDGALLICDAGTGLRQLGLGWRKRPVQETHAHLFVSHTHWDHIQGFPFFAPAYNKEVTLHLYDPWGQGDIVRQRLLGQLVPEHCPIGTGDLKARIETAALVDGATIADRVTVHTIRQNHPGGSWAYAFESAGRKVIYATDSELDLELLNPSEVEQDPEQDRICPDHLVKFMQGADLLIADAQYTDEQYRTRRGWGHSRLFTVVDLALAAHVKRLALFHHDPDNSDAQVQQMAELAQARAKQRGSDIEIFAAQEGAEITLQG
jgi:phosphoribosyl 1,2-cyclic phosphodiesterase